jgi:hypothetical protein
MESPRLTYGSEYVSSATFAIRVLAVARQHRTLINGAGR